MNYANPETPATTERELLERYAALALDKQLTMQEVLGEHNWNADLTAGTVSFGPDRTFPMQVLGSFSFETDTWLWAWENTQAPIPDAVMAQAVQLRAFGEAHDLEIFTVGCFDATLADLLLIGTVASGMFGASAYYVADYGRGRLLLTMQSAEIDQFPVVDLARIPSAFMQVVQAYEMDHRPALLHYLAQKGYSPIETPDTISVAVDGGTIVATFDELGRVTNLTAGN